MTSPIEGREELREQLAAIEHERWADWQKWQHSKMHPEKVLLPEDMSRVETGNMVMWKDDYDRWQRQIITPYSELSDDEKMSDMIQVNRYWPLIGQFITQTLKEAIPEKRTPIYKNGKVVSEVDSVLSNATPHFNSGYNRAIDDLTAKIGKL